MIMMMITVSDDFSGSDDFSFQTYSSFSRSFWLVLDGSRSFLILVIT